MKRSWIVVFLFMLFQASFFLVHMPEGYTTTSSYFYERHVQDLLAKKHFSFYDPLSYEGRYFPFPPFFFVIMAFFTFLFGSSAFYLTPLLLVLLIPLGYALVLFLTKNETSALVSAGLIATLPILGKWYAVLDPFVFVLLFFFLTLYLFLRTKQRKEYELWYLFVFICFTLTSPFVFLYVGLLFSYFVLVRLEEKQITKKELELFFFSLFFPVWFYLILYKKILFEKGFTILWRNIPQVVFSKYFAGFTFVSFLSALGIVLYLFGLYAFYRVIVAPPKKEFLLFPSLITLVFLGLFFRWLLPEEGFTLLGLSFALLVGSFWSSFTQYIKTLKFSSLAPFGVGFLIVLLFLTNVLAFLQQVQQQKPVLSSDELKVLTWIRKNTPEQSVIAAPYDHGHLITFFANRKVIADSFFFGIDHPALVLQSLQELYTTPFVTQALEILNQYHASYLLVHPSFFPPEKKTLAYLSDTRCFSNVFRYNAWEVYAVKCQLTSS